MDTEKAMGVPYTPRVLDGALAEALATAGAVVIEGPRASGKTMTALHAAGSAVFLDDPAVADLMSIAPGGVLDGEAPRLLDEWQLAPQLWNLVRRAVDRQSGPGRFILTGSAVPDDDVTRHTGAGRFLRLRQRTMSWFERGASSGVVSLRELFDGNRPHAADAVGDYRSVVANLVRSGFPALAGLPESRQAMLLRAYLNEVARIDLARLAAIRHEPVVITQLLRALARNTASEVSLTTLAADLSRVAPAVKAETVGNYLQLLERVFVVERQRAWSPGLRSKARLRNSDRLHLADPALAAVALHADSERLANDPTTAGFVFESAVFHDLAVYASAVGGDVLHYRDSNGHEIDMVVVLPDGRWGAVEVKLGAGQVVAGQQSLRRAIEQIDTSQVGEPAFRLVLTGTGGTFVADDGTVTCSLGQLSP